MKNLGKSIWLWMVALVVGLSLGAYGPLQADDDENGEGGPELKPAAPLLQPAPNPLRGLSNRWRLLNAYGVYVPPYSIIDPYNQNILKGDFPIAGQETFVVLTGIYNPAGVFTSQTDADPQFNNKFVGEFELFHGLTVFRPKDWSIKVAGEGFFNRGQNDNEDFGLKQAFGELKLFDVGEEHYDFTSFRGGVQFFKSDFNGFIFQDFNLGGQLFGELSSNRYRWALAYFKQLQKENGFIKFDELNQDVLIANLVAEEWFSPGFITELSIHYNRDRQLGELDVLYLGIATDGNIGRFDFNPVVYFALGSETGGFDEFGSIQAERDITAFFAGAELQYPNNYMNYRAAVFVASGDSDPNDDKAQGFDSILDNVNLFGGVNSFVVGGGNFGTRLNSFIPSFRQVGTSSNFNGPGMLAANLGLDMVLTPKLFFESNFNYFQFLQEISPGISKTLGFEVNGAFAYRLDLNENLILNVGANAFFPQSGAEAFLGNKDLILTGNVNLIFLY